VGQRSAYIDKFPSSSAEGNLVFAQDILGDQYWSVPGLFNGEVPPGCAAPAGIGGSRGIPGAHMPVIGAGGQAAEGFASDQAGGAPGGGTGIIIGGIDAVLVIDCIFTGSPAQGGIGGLVGGAIGWADLIESAG